jgi:two-component system, response regulator YesN
MYKTLIVDDDWTYRHILVKMITSIDSDFEIVAEAEDGKAALEILGNLPVDVVFTDIRMPGVNGLEFLRNLKENQKEVEVIFISIYDEFEYAQQGIVLGAFDYLLKPIDIEKISSSLLRLKKLLQEKAQKHQLQQDTAKAIADNFSAIYSKEDEAEVLSLIFRNPTKALAYAAEIAEKLFVYFNNDIFKTGIILDNMMENIYWVIRENYPWIINFQDNQPYMFESFHLSKTPKVAILKLQKELYNVIQIISKFHLDQTDALIHQLCEFVVANIEGKVTLETIAHQLNFTADHLGKLFKSNTGENFNSFVSKMKIERAKILIRSGKYKNYEISEKLGYQDTDYFSKLFKAYCGQTPSEYRRSSHQLFFRGKLKKKVAPCPGSDSIQTFPP